MSFIIRLPTFIAVVVVVIVVIEVTVVVKQGMNSNEMNWKYANMAGKTTPKMMNGFLSGVHGS